MFRLYLLLIVVGLLSGAAYGAYYYYTSTQAQIATLIQNSAKLEIAAETQKNTITALEKDAEKFAKLNKQLNSKLQNADKYRDTLIDKLRKHNLTKLSQKKPALVEKKINNGTKKLFKSFESITALPAN